MNLTSTHSARKSSLIFNLPAPVKFPLPKISSVHFYCNCLLFDVPNRLLDKLQKWRIMSLLVFAGDVNTFLRELLWLPIRACIDDKMAKLCYRCFPFSSNSACAFENLIISFLIQQIPPLTPQFLPFLHARVCPALIHLLLPDCFYCVYLLDSLWSFMHAGLHK